MDIFQQYSNVMVNYADDKSKMLLFIKYVDEFMCYIGLNLHFMIFNNYNKSYSELIS